MWEIKKSLCHMFSKTENRLTDVGFNVTSVGVQVGEGNPSPVCTAHVGLVVPGQRRQTLQLLQRSHSEQEIKKQTIQT